MKDELLPGLDMALYGLISDLDARGMLDETLVLLLSEHGRTPKLSAAKGGGRDHWSRAYSILMAGGGVARGRVVGKTDKIAGDVVERPVSPKDAGDGVLPARHRLPRDAAARSAAAAGAGAAGGIEGHRRSARVMDLGGASGDRFILLEPVFLIASGFF
jgi:arylsulfatase A-like enzyme